MLHLNISELPSLPIMQLGNMLTERKGTQKLTSKIDLENLWRLVMQAAPEN